MRAPPLPDVREPAALAAAAAAVEAQMRAAVGPRGDATDEVYRWLSYHLGWADALGRPCEERTAKGLRPRVCLLAAAAAGADPAVAVAAAAAIELTHEFSLVHDDIQDGDRVRRGRPSLWTVVGTAQAINCGDLLFGLARAQLAQGGLPAEAHVALSARYDDACTRLAEGQYLDMSFERGGRIDVDAYVDMVARKTGALLGAAGGMGAVSAGAPAAVADGLSRFGEAVGVAFQMQDDVLGIWGDPRLTGKPVGGDLSRRKRSLPVLLALADPDLAREVEVVFAADPPDPGAAGALAGALARAGLLERTQAEARAWSERALAQLAPLPLAPGAAAALAELAGRAVRRDR